MPRPSLKKEFEFLSKLLDNSPKLEKQLKHSSSVDVGIVKTLYTSVPNIYLLASAITAVTQFRLTAEIINSFLPSLSTNYSNTIYFIDEISIDKLSIDRKTVLVPSNSEMLNNNNNTSTAEPVISHLTLPLKETLFLQDTKEHTDSSSAVWNIVTIKYVTPNRNLNPDSIQNAAAKMQLIQELMKIKREKKGHIVFLSRNTNTLSKELFISLSSLLTKCSKQNECDNIYENYVDGSMDLKGKWPLDEKTISFPENKTTSVKKSLESIFPESIIENSLLLLKYITLLKCLTNLHEEAKKITLNCILSDSLPEMKSPFLKREVINIRAYIQCMGEAGVDVVALKELFLKLFNTSNESAHLMNASSDLTQLQIRLASIAELAKSILADTNSHIKTDVLPKANVFQRLLQSLELIITAIKKLDPPAPIMYNNNSNINSANSTMREKIPSLKRKHNFIEDANVTLSNNISENKNEVYKKHKADDDMPINPIANPVPAIEGVVDLNNNLRMH